MINPTINTRIAVNETITTFVEPTASLILPFLVMRVPLKSKEQNPIAASVSITHVQNPEVCTYMPDGVCDYFLMWICVGLPFGIRRMCLWLVPSGYGISGSVGIFALNLIIGGLIGGLAFFIGLLLGVIHTIREII